MTLAIVLNWLRSTWIGKAVVVVTVAVTAALALIAYGGAKERSRASQADAAATLEAIKERRSIDQIVREATDEDLVDALSRD